MTASPKEAKNLSDADESASLPKENLSAADVAALALKLGIIWVPEES